MGLAKELFILLVKVIGGDGNVAVIVKHTLSDNSEFYAIYGHVRTTVKKNSPIEGGIPFASVGHWPYGDHLHFGIVGPGNALQAPFGMLPNWMWPDTNGFVEPISFINTYSPKRNSKETKRHS